MECLPNARLCTPREETRRGGFVALRVKGAAHIVATLRKRGVYVDSRGDILRLGPAPYTTDDEIDRACYELRPLLG